MSSDQKPLSKDVEFLEKLIRWLGEKGEAVSDFVGGLIRRVFRSQTHRVVEKYQGVVDKINGFEAQVESLTQEQIQERVAAFKQRLDGVEPDDQEVILEEILPEVFALVRESAKRTIGLRHYDVQLVGGIVLHSGSIAEMATGEGKTLVATCPAALNALAGRGVYVVTVNDYLAKRDRDWMAPVFEYIGLTVGAIQSNMDPVDRHPQYSSDITYGTNNEFGFDYLRDNMKSRPENQVQTHLHYAIIDEVDSILVDEARTPLIISGMPEASSRKYYLADGVSRKLREGVHFEVKEKEHSVVMTEEGIETAQKLLNVPSFYEGPHMDWPHHIEQSLKAHYLYKLDKHYVKRPDEKGAPEIVIIDEFTGRMMPGRRWSDGLHQAVEAKEGIRTREENQTLATITFQNYFRLYHKIAGMTGTAITEAGEFAKIYNLGVVQVPTNRPNQRIDHHDVIYRTEGEKFPSIVDELVEMHDSGRPVLVGTASIEKSELLSHFLSDPKHMIEVLGRRSTKAEQSFEKAKKVSDELKAEVRDLTKAPARMDAAKARDVADRVAEADGKSDLAFWMDGVARAAQAVEYVRRGLPHSVLNAKFHEKEADIVAQAGQRGAITIATNMAGRGTDIVLGGNPKFLAEDKVAECGDPSRYQEFLTEFEESCGSEREQLLELGGLHVLGTERHESRRIDNQLRGRTARQGDPGSSRFYLSLQDDLMRIFATDRVNRILETFGMTEDVDIQSPMVSRSIQRAQKKVESRNFEIRKNLLEYDEVMDKQRRRIYSLRQDVLEGGDQSERIRDMVADEIDRLTSIYLGQDKESFDVEGLCTALNQKFGTDKFVASDYTANEREPMIERALELARELYTERETDLTEEVLRRLERQLLLHVIDGKWKDHLQNIDALRAGVGLRSYAQVDPKNEFKKEGFRLFEEMLGSIGEEVTNIIYRLRPAEERPAASAPEGGQATPMATAAASAVARRPAAASPVMQNVEAQRRSMESAATNAGRERGPTGPIKREMTKVGRNDPCPCGSGKKYKKCHGV